MGSVWLWAGFNLAVLALLALDLFVVHRRAHAVGMGEAALWRAITTLTHQASVRYDSLVLWRLLEGQRV